MSSRIVFQPSLKIQRSPKLQPSLKLRLTRLAVWWRLLPQALVGKRPAGSCFQVLFESSSAPIVVKTNSGDNAPRRIFGGMRRTALIVGDQTLPEVFRRTDIALFGMGETLEQVDVSHLCEPVRGLPGTTDNLMKRGGIEPTKEGVGHIILGGGPPSSACADAPANYGGPPALKLRRTTSRLRPAGRSLDMRISSFSKVRLGLRGDSDSLMKQG